MTRKPAFDRDKVLAAAGNVFRMRGYRDVSIADLEKATGLVSGSIYNAFGDKAGLFRAALDHYVQHFVVPRLNSQAGPTASLEDLEGLFVSVLEAPLDDGFGCLVNNSIVEFGAAPGIASDSVNETLSLVRTGIGATLKRELGADSGADSMRLLLLYHGVLTLSRSGMPFAAMRAAVEAEFRSLRARRDARTRDLSTGSQLKEI